MPTYTFFNQTTQAEETHFLKISELDSFTQNNPNLIQKPSAPAIGDSVRLGVSKTPDSFNSLLKHIKKGNEKGFTKSTINTR